MSLRGSCPYCEEWFASESREELAEKMAEHVINKHERGRV